MRYYAQTGKHSVQASADAALVARWYFLNPVGSTARVHIARIDFSSQISSVLVVPSCPMLQLETFKFTGTASGAAIAPAKQQWDDPDPTATIRTAANGITIVTAPPNLPKVVTAFFPIAGATAVGFVAAPRAVWEPNPEGQAIILKAGEGMMFRQAEAGTAADTRKFLTTIVWDEHAMT